ncbi:ergot alkaloid biosynthesis protein [Saccharopolyspora sp. WRP15-2]|uniref:Ergot alkaloid biosynthesis protein n=1 Tax=Saccharopolyspora oryzae TaxID=2997343 RepID=A0ABT4V0D1_9PSEU|nr:ergot alkaloid biosynthesis protein [Saccharopolyspora oryzae]MDA3627426.1 ergot alkaloid biosynthesis protein [Saccharopolyspora oryzae]
MTVLITGGTGKTGRPLAALLRERGIAVRIASRHPGADPDQVRFDWSDPRTHGPALDGADRVYLVPPIGVLDPMPLVEPFLRAAEGRRVVLLGSLAVIPGLDELRERVAAMPDSAVLRPSGFMQNFTGPHPVAVDLRERGVIRTATGNGRLGWIDAADIAAVAAAVLTSGEVAGEYLLTGPESLSYAETAAILTEITGRPVRHHDVTRDERARQLASGVPADFAAALAAMDVDIRAGSEDLVTSTVPDLTGRPARSFRDFARANRAECTPPPAPRPG